MAFEKAINVDCLKKSIAESLDIESMIVDENYKVNCLIYDYNPQF